MKDVIGIPEDRVAHLIGKKGKTKELIEKMGNVKLKINGTQVEIEGDSLDIMKVKDIIKAIGLGFSFNDLVELFRDDVQLAIYDIEEICPNKETVERQIGRIIGREGRTKKFFEKTLGLRLSIKNNKVAAVGSPEDLEIFREALEKLVHGSPHSSVYKFVERRLASKRLEKMLEGDNLG